MINRIEQFIDREEELSFLEENYRKRRFTFIVVYGRRRVGKTFLAKKFLEGKPSSAYFYVSEMSPRELRGELAALLWERLGVRSGVEPSWDSIFRALMRASRERRIVFVIDEFQRLLDVDRRAITDLQRVIDEEADGSSLMIITMGSSVGVMERMFRYGEPLYGRATGFLRIRPFTFRAAHRYLAARLGADPVESMELYGVFGGTPHYLSLLEERDWLGEAERLVFDHRGPLYLEPELLLKTELREHVVYFEILRRLAEGKRSFSELAGSLGSARTSLSYYLGVLINDLDLVSRDEPIGGRRRPVYRIKDNFFAFWFRYVLPNRSYLELGDTGYALEKVRADFNAYMGMVFQEALKESLYHMILPFKPAAVGSWWSKNIEIDAVAVDAEMRKAAILEAKWRSLGLRDALRILSSLEHKASALEYPYKYFGVAARSFAPGVKEELRSRGYLAYDAADIAGLEEEQRENKPSGDRERRP